MTDTMGTRKLFPRNATARSHYWVTGNPVTTRPESGVDNCFPGLEFDQRNLDKRFFPGLEFELHLAGVLRSIDPASRADLAHEITDADIQRGIKLYAVHGTFGEARAGERRRTVEFPPRGGLEDWRIIHDLEPGLVAIAVGPLAGTQAPSAFLAAFATYLAGGAGQTVVQREGDGSFRFAFATGLRARYLDADGVIDPAEFRPGDLTRSLCSPWQYDFALCGCFYWASNKPDMVQKDADSPQFSNFQRRKANGEPAVEPITDYAAWESLTPGSPVIVTPQEMVGSWESLPAVFDGIEGTGTAVAPPPQLPTGDILDRPAVISALRELATVEHGLMVEYLYAYYSINQNAFADQPATRLRVRSAAETILSVAIDEMRHLRWVNEMLLSLGQAHELGRFTDMPDVDRDGRFLQHTFSLKRLTPERLVWFIAVEAPSNRIDLGSGDDTVDGMYTRLLLSVSQGAGFTEEEKRRLVHRIKLIIDEGYDHFQRFTRVRERLTGIDPAAYLRLVDDPAPQPASAIAHVFETVADAAYAGVLDLLSRLLTPSNVGRIDALIIAARELMYNLDEAARSAALNGGAPLFRLPEESGLGAPAPMAAAFEVGPVSAAGFVQAELVPALERVLSPVRDLPGGISLAQSMMQRLETAQARLRALE